MPETSKIKYCSMAFQEMSFGCIMLSSVGWLVSCFMESLAVKNDSMYEKSNFSHLLIKVQNA